MSIRKYAIPDDAFILHCFDEDTTLKSFAGYKEAKAGNADAALSLIGCHIIPWLLSVKSQLPQCAVFVAPFAREMTGDNALPQVLADACALVTGGQVDTNIVQTTRVFHTGADPMERMITRPKFDGDVIKDHGYVLVDDVTTMGGTLAELSNYIQTMGGRVQGIVVIVNAGRDKKFYPDIRTIKLLQERFSDEIRQIFEVEVQALTANEANYLVGFRTVDEIRNRCTKAKKELDLRLCSKGVKKIS
jgi:hypothetical protein